MGIERRYVRVGVYDSRAKTMVADVTLAPGADIIVGSGSDCTVPVPQNLEVVRHVLILGGRLLLFAPGMRLQMSSETGDLVMAEAEELLAAGTTSPTPLKWSRLNVRLRRPELSVFVKYLSPGETTDPALRNLEPGVELSTRDLCLKLARTFRISIGERLRLPGRRVPWSELVAAIRASLSSERWFPRAPLEEGEPVGDGALLELRGDEVWVHEQHEIDVFRFSPVESYRADSLEDAVRAYVRAHGGPPMDGVEIDWDG